VPQNGMEEACKEMPFNPDGSCPHGYSTIDGAAVFACYSLPQEPKYIKAKAKEGILLFLPQHINPTRAVKSDEPMNM
jgi:hypothetical protein